MGGQFDLISGHNSRKTSSVKSIPNIDRNIIHPDELTENLREGGRVRFLRLEDLLDQDDFYGVLEGPGRKRKYFYTFDKRKAQIASLDATVVYIETAINTDEMWIDYPLIKSSELEDDEPFVTVRMMEPKPYIRWKAWQGEDPLLGPANRHGSKLKLMDLFMLARKSGAKLARVEIGSGARAALRGRKRRIEILQQALNGKTINAWAIENNLHYANVRNAMMRGDGFSDVKALVAKETGRKEEDLWPDETWDW